MACIWNSPSNNLNILTKQLRDTTGFFVARVRFLFGWFFEVWKVPLEKWDENFKTPLEAIFYGPTSPNGRSMESQPIVTLNQWSPTGTSFQVLQIYDRSVCFFPINVISENPFHSAAHVDRDIGFNNHFPIWMVGSPYNPVDMCSGL